MLGAPIFRAAAARFRAISGDFERGWGLEDPRFRGLSFQDFALVFESFQTHSTFARSRVWGMAVRYRPFKILPVLDNDSAIKGRQ